jgi:hypothetical protein
MDGTKMKNDLLESLTSPAPDDLAKIEEISKYRFDRATAENWALVDIKFLIYDNTEYNDQHEYNSDDEEAMLGYAIKMSCEHGESSPYFEAEKLDNAACVMAPSDHLPSVASFFKCADEQETLSCRVCDRIPSFRTATQVPFSPA